MCVCVCVSPFSLALSLFALPLSALMGLPTRSASINNIIKIYYINYTIHIIIIYARCAHTTDHRCEVTSTFQYVIIYIVSLHTLHNTHHRGGRLGLLAANRHIYYYYSPSRQIYYYYYSPNRLICYSPNRLICYYYSRNRHIHYYHNYRYCCLTSLCTLH